jgi:hypothetical protein
MDMLEIGLYSAVTVYGVIVIWTVLVRLRWLPTALVRLVHRPMNRLGRIPVLGRVVNICRRYSLTLGLGLAILVGAAVPYVVLSIFWAVQAVVVAGAILLWLYFGGQEEADGVFESPDPNGLYYSVYDGVTIVPGCDVEADARRPWLGS